MGGRGGKSNRGGSGGSGGPASAKAKQQLGQPEEPKKEEPKKSTKEALDPFDTWRSGGEAGLRRSLEGLDEADLHQIVRQSRMDRSGRTKKWGKDRLIEHIMNRTASDMNKGSVFQNYQG